MLGEDFAARWLVWHKQVKETSDATLERYARVLKELLAWCEKREINPLEITEDELKAFAMRPIVKGKRTGLTRSPKTREVERTILRGWYDWLARKRITSIADPTIDMPAPKVRNNNPQPVELHHWLKLWTSDLSPRWRFSLGAAYFLGLRPTEICGLYSHQLKDNLIWNLHGKGDTLVHYPWRLVIEILSQFHPEVYPEPFINAYMLARRAPKPCPWANRQAMYYAIQIKSRDLWIPESAITPRRMRSSAATNLMEAGLPEEHVILFTRHATTNMLRKYVKNTGANIRRWFDRERARYETQ